MKTNLFNISSYRTKKSVEVSLLLMYVFNVTILRIIMFFLAFSFIQSRGCLMF